MKLSLLQPPPRGALCRALLLISGMAMMAGPARAQDEAAPPAEAAPTEAMPPAEGTAEATPETIPVDAPSEAPPAAEPSRRPYTYAATRLRHTEFDDTAEDAFGVEGSYLLLPNFYALGAVLAAESDDARGTTATQYEIGGGYLAPLSAATDLNLALRVIQRDVDSEPQSQVLMGYQFDAGVRTDLSPRAEGTLAARYTESSRSSRMSLVGAALFTATPQLSFGVEALLSTNSVAYGLIGRWAF